MTLMNNLIAIDTEYHTDNNGKIDKVYCIAATREGLNDAKCHSETPFKAWLTDLSSNEKEGILEAISMHFGVSEPIFICHAYDKAERRALKFLGVDVSKYRFLCTYHLAKQLTFNMDKTQKSPDEGTAIRASHKKAMGLSYAMLCLKYGLGLIDTAHKAEMRQLCIDDNTAGNEESIMNYCLEDVQYLLPLFRHLATDYSKILFNSWCPLANCRPITLEGRTVDEIRDTFIKFLLQQMRAITMFGEIADRGLPINVERVNKIRSHGVQYREALKSNLNNTYEDLFIYDQKTHTYKRNEAKVQYYLYNELKQLGIIDGQNRTSYPITSTGKLSTSNDALKEYFKQLPDSFGERLRQTMKITTVLNKVASDDSENPLNSIYNSKLWYESLEPYASKTTRCQPRKKFLFGWHKSFYGLLDPPEGKWLVELDYSSEETFIQACICKDEKYYKIYSSKDIYLAFAVEMGLIPRDDFNALSVDDLKHKYKAVRNLVKPMILGLSYGMGAERLARRLNISIKTGEEYLKKIKSIIFKTTSYKAAICELYKTGKVHGICTPDGAICSVNPRSFSATTLINCPFQSAGGYILRCLVNQIRKSGLPLELLATIHDAIFFEVNEGDYETIEKVKQIMINTANKVLQAPNEWTIKVGDPEIIKHGEIWTPDHAYDEQFESLLNYTE